MPKKKNIIKVGDWVKIINPEFFVRCGYPLCLADTREEMTEQHGKEVDDFICKILKFESKADILFNSSSYKREACRFKIIDALSRFDIYLKGFGGRERKIYTKHIPDHQGKIYRVFEKSFKVSGVYVPGFSHTGYNGEYDYEPAYLDRPKRHNLLHLSSYTVENWTLSIYDDSQLNIIEDIHVEKVENNDPSIFCEQALSK